MPKTLTRALGALALLAAHPAQADTGRLGWSVKPSKDGQVQLSLSRQRNSGHNMNTTTVPANFGGVDWTDASGPVRFTVRRDPGTMTCQGEVRQARGQGDCSFVRSPEFDAVLARAGMARPTDGQSWDLATLDARMSTIAELRRLGFAPTTSQLMSVTVHRADGDWLAGIAAAGRRGDTLDQIVTYRIHGISGEWLRGLMQADSGLRTASAEQIVSMKIHGVRPEWVEGLRAAGLRDVPADELVAMRIHGITPEFTRAALAAGVRPTSGNLIGRRLRGGVR